MARSFIANVITGQTPDTSPALPDTVTAFTGSGRGMGVGAGGGVGAGVGGVGAGVGVGAGGGVGAAAAAWVTFTAVPATTTDTGLAAPEFDDTITRTAASPRPEAGVTDAHATPLLAFQAHAEFVWTVTVSSPPCD